MTLLYNYDFGLLVTVTEHLTVTDAWRLALVSIHSFGALNPSRWTYGRFAGLTAEGRQVGEI